MTATQAKGSRRYSREQRQEDLSEGLFRARLADVGWPCDRLGRDLGEDLHVRIYEDGASTGLSFYVQLKSTASVARLKRAKTPTFTYRLEVKDLLHWETQATLVVLVVWDVKKQTGWWRPIPEIIKDLDTASKTWRTKGTAMVRVPFAKNGTDDEGLKRLRWAVADHNLLLVPKPKRSELKLFFPKTAEGALALAAFKRAFDEGDEVDLGGGELLAPKVEHPEWHRRIYGDFDGSVRITIGRSKPFTVPVRVDLESSQGTASVPYIELRAIKHGRRRTVFSNEHQGHPVKLYMDIGDTRSEATLSVKGRGRDVYEAQETAAVLLVMAQPEARVRVTALTKERPEVVVPLGEPVDEATVARIMEWRALVEKLVFIQQRLPSQRIHIPEGDIPAAEAAFVERVFTILSRGREHASISLSGLVTPEEGALQQLKFLGDQASVSIGRGEGEPIKFFNAIFEPGAFRVVLEEPRAFFKEWERQLRDAKSTGEKKPIKIENVRVIYEYPEWIPEGARWDTLAQIGLRQDGYVTLSQARWVGYTDDIFLALIPSGKVEQVTPDVFRLVHFPRSDHEELIVLWLQTGRAGVISHDTALLLHGLSDILPRRRHITVPPGWDPGGRELDANVVLHHAEIGEGEIRWLGPIPYTAPLRTLRDCIASHLEPDLIEQAVADGLRRGMFTEAELPPGARRGAA